RRILAGWNEEKWCGRTISFPRDGCEPAARAVSRRSAALFRLASEVLGCTLDVFGAQPSGCPLLQCPLRAICLEHRVLVLPADQRRFGKGERGLPHLALTSVSDAEQAPRAGIVSLRPHHLLEEAHRVLRVSRVVGFDLHPRQLPLEERRAGAELERLLVSGQCLVDPAVLEQHLAAQLVEIRIVRMFGYELVDRREGPSEIGNSVIGDRAGIAGAHRAIALPVARQGRARRKNEAV